MKSLLYVIGILNICLSRESVSSYVFKKYDAMFFEDVKFEGKINNQNLII